jgi:hypothetical protein
MNCDKSTSTLQIGGLSIAVGGLDNSRFARTFELDEVLRVSLSEVPGIRDLRLLDGGQPKLFVITEDTDLARDYKIIQILVQMEDIKPNLTLHYDLVPGDRAHMIPAHARSLCR